MIQLPSEQTLVQHVREALTKASESAWNNITADSIASEIAKRLKKDSQIKPYVRCYSGKSEKPEGCDGAEFRFDFCALLYENRDPGFLVQAAILGETEWSPKDKDTDWDFEKLLLTDSIICFFVCCAKTVEEANKKLNRYEQAVNIRKKYAKKRYSQPPKFLLACYEEPRLHTEPPAEPMVRVV